MANKDFKTCALEGCLTTFPHRFTRLPEYCSSRCAIEAKRKKGPDKERKQINKISSKRKAENAIYLVKRKVFLLKKENSICPVTGDPATEVHHKKGRVGSLFLNEDFWLGVSRKGHKWIEENPTEAKEKGWSLSRLGNG